MLSIEKCRELMLESAKYTDEEITEIRDSLDALAHICFDVWLEDRQREKRLKESPNGFHLEGGYSCSVCGGGASDDQSWYDKYGIKCMICQGAIDRKEIPATLAKNKNSWYSKYDLESCFNIKGQILRSWVKKGILKQRTITHNGQVHLQLFLIKDNKDTLPPKKLVESRLGKETVDGKEYHRSYPWYRFVDPREHLKGYKIMDYLRVTHGNKG